MGTAEHIGLPDYLFQIPKTQDYLICYIDLLGSKSNISENDEEIFENIYNAYSVAMAMNETKVFDRFEFKVFSDNILIAQKVPDKTDFESIFSVYKNLSKFLQLFLFQFAKRNMLFRGGITLNSLAINEMMVWGRGLSEVVNYEEKLAIYPRIVISNSLIEIFKANISEKEFFDEKYYCLKDADGLYFFDYINYAELPDAEYLLTKGYKEFCKKAKNETDIKIMQKYNWHKRYLHIARNIFNEYYGEFNPIRWDEET